MNYIVYPAIRRFLGVVLDYGNKKKHLCTIVLYSREHATKPKNNKLNIKESSTRQNPNACNKDVGWRNLNGLNTKKTPPALEF